MAGATDRAGRIGLEWPGEAPDLLDAVEADPARLAAAVAAIRAAFP